MKYIIKTTTKYLKDCSAIDVKEGDKLISYHGKHFVRNYELPNDYNSHGYTIEELDEVLKIMSNHIKSDWYERTIELIFVQE